MKLNWFVKLVNQKNSQVISFFIKYLSSVSHQFSDQPQSSEFFFRSEQSFDAESIVQHFIGIFDEKPVLMDVFSEIANDFDAENTNTQLVCCEVFKKQIFIFVLPIDHVNLTMVKKPFFEVLNNVLDHDLLQG